MVDEQTGKGPERAEKKAPGNALRRQQIVDVLADPKNRGKKRPELAKMVGISERQFRKYITPALLREAREAHHRHHVPGEMLEVDRAMLKKAGKDGDVPAAKLMYQRFDGMGDKDSFQETPLEINIIARGGVNTAEAGVRIRARRGRQI